MLTNLTPGEGGDSSCGTAAAGLRAEDAEVDVDDPRVELRPGPLAEAPAGLGGREALPVGPVGGHGVEGVADEDDARLERDLLAALSVRVARAVPVLVAVAHDRPHVLEPL